MMKSGSANHKPNPPAVNGGQAKKFKKANQKQKKTDVREGLTGPAANASGPFPPGQRPLQCHKCKGWGHVRRVCPSCLNFTRGGVRNRALLPWNRSLWRHRLHLQRRPNSGKSSEDG